MIISTALAAASFYGLHEGGEMMRSFDAFFVIGVGGVVALSMLSNSATLTEHLWTKHRASPPVVTTLALLVYSGLRMVRNAIFTCAEISERSLVPTIDHSKGETVVVSGCTLCNALSASAMAACGAGAMIPSAIVLFRSVSAESDGDGFDVERAIIPLAAGASVQAVGLITTIVAFAHTCSALDSIYGPEACSSAISECVGAMEMRRINAISHGIAPCVLALMSLATLIARLSGIGDATMASHDDEKNVLSKRRGRRAAYSLIACACIYIGMVIVWSGDWSTVYSHTEVASLLALIGIVVTATISTSIGSMLLFLSCIVEVGMHLWINARSLAPFATYLTYISNTILLLMFAVLVILDVGSLVVHRFTPTWMGAIDGFEMGGSIICTCGRSISMFLLLASTALIAAYDGSPIPLRDGPNAEQRTAFAFLLWHYVPAAAWAAASYQYRPIGSLCALILTWTLSTIGVVLIYISVILSTGEATPTSYPQTHMVNLVAAAIGIVLPPWVAAMR